MNLLHDGFSALLPNRKAHVRRPVFEFTFDGIELRDESQHLPALLGDAVFDLDKFPSRVAPAVRELEVGPTLLQRLILAIAVAHLGAGEIFEQLRGRIGTAVRGVLANVGRIFGRIFGNGHTRAIGEAMKEGLVIALVISLASMASAQDVTPRAAALSYENMQQQDCEAPVRTAGPTAGVIVSTATLVGGDVLALLGGLSFGDSARSTGQKAMFGSGLALLGLSVGGIIASSIYLHRAKEKKAYQKYHCTTSLLPTETRK